MLCDTISGVAIADDGTAGGERRWASRVACQSGRSVAGGLILELAG